MSTPDRRGDQEEDLADVDVEANDANVVGHSTEDGVGAEGGRRRQIRE